MLKDAYETKKLKTGRQQVISIGKKLQKSKLVFCPRTDRTTIKNKK